ncbi:RNA-binding protein isoform X3 [Carex rostrata]
MAQESSSSDQKSIEASAEPELTRTGSFSRLNAKAPEFVPRTSDRVVVPIHHHPHQHPIHVFHPSSPSAAYFAAPPPQFDYFGGYVEHDVVSNTVEPDPTPSQPVAGKEGREGLSDDVIQKITKQVEYYFSDINLATTEHLMRFISKDPDGYVPINIIAGFKKIKALIQSNTQLATALRTSSKLVVSDDGKRVKRQVPFTEADMEELQSRIVVAENLPEDHCYQNLMKIFSAVGSVKTIRTCYPQTSNGTAPATNRSAKLDMLFANKLHAFVEYETIEDAEKAIGELNDERNWRIGLRVRLLQGCIPGGVKGKKDGEEEDGSTSSNLPSNEKSPHQLLPDESSPPEPSHDNAIDESTNEKDFGGGGRRGKGGRGRGGKGRGRGSHMALHHHHNNNNNNHNHRPGTSNNPGTPTSSHSPTHAEQVVVAMKQPPGPRMPDGTRGFTMGRGKPLTQVAN